MRKLMFLLLAFIVIGCGTEDEKPEKVKEFSIDKLHADYEKLWKFDAVYNEDRSRNLSKVHQIDDALLFSKDGQGMYIHGEVPREEGPSEVQGDYFTWERAGKGIRIMGLHNESRLMNNGLLVFETLTEDEISYTLNIDVFGEKEKLRHIELTPMVARVNNPSDTMINLTNGMVKTWKLTERYVNGENTVVDAWLEDNSLIMLHDGRGIYVKGEKYKLKSDTTTNDHFRWAFNETGNAILISEAEHRGLCDVERWNILELNASEFTTNMYRNKSGDSVKIIRVPYTE